MLQLVPANPAKSGLKEHLVLQPIRFVSESYTEAPIREIEDSFVR